MPRGRRCFVLFLSLLCSLCFVNFPFFCHSYPIRILSGFARSSKIESVSNRYSIFKHCGYPQQSVGAAAACTPTLRAASTLLPVAVERLTTDQCSQSDDEDKRRCDDDRSCSETGELADPTRRNIYISATGLVYCTAGTENYTQKTRK